MRKSQLPPEIIEAIIDEVASLNDEDTLKICAQVAHAFAYPTQKYLFRSINLAPTAPQGSAPQLSSKLRAQKFHRLLSSSPRIGLYAQELSIEGDVPRRCIPEQCNRSPWTTCTWFICANPDVVSLLPQILEGLPNMRSFSLVLSNITMEARGWEEIPAPSRSALEHVFQTTAIQTVTLSFLTNFTYQALTLLLNVPELILFNISMGQKQVAEEDIQNMHSMIKRPRLQALTLSRIPPCTTRALSRVLTASSHSKGTLSKLSIVPRSDANGFCDALEELIKTAGINIHQFEWLAYATGSAPALIDMRLMPHLSTLRFKVNYSKPNFFSDALRLLRQISNDQISSSYGPSIEHLIICCRFFYPEQVKLPRYEPDWAALDNMLARPGLASPREVTMEVDSQERGVNRNPLDPSRIARFRSCFQDVLPKLHKRDVLLSIATYTLEVV